MMGLSMHGARFREEFTPDDAVGSHAIPLGRPPSLTVATVNHVATLKVSMLQLALAVYITNHEPLPQTAE
jgi:hypothetical protein